MTPSQILKKLEDYFIDKSGPDRDYFFELLRQRKQGKKIAKFESFGLTQMNFDDKLDGI